jgi:hypothetical protein
MEGKASDAYQVKCIRTASLGLDPGKRYIESQEPSNEEFARLKTARQILDEYPGRCATERDFDYVRRAVASPV